MWLPIVATKSLLNCISFPVFAEMTCPPPPPLNSSRTLWRGDPPTKWRPNELNMSMEEKKSEVNYKSLLLLNKMLNRCAEKGFKWAKETMTCHSALCLLPKVLIFWIHIFIFRRLWETKDGVWGLYLAPQPLNSHLIPQKWPFTLSPSFFTWPTHWWVPRYRARKRKPYN